MPFFSSEEKAEPTLVSTFPPSDLSFKKILVIDDEPMVIEVVVDTLLSRRYAVLSTTNPEEGISLFKKYEKEIGLVLLDFSMPIMNGEEVFQHLREINPAIPVILSSGYTEEEVTKKFKETGLAGFIQKPYKPEYLLQTIIKHLQQK